MTEYFETRSKKGRGMARGSLDLIEAMYAAAEAPQAHRTATDLRQFRIFGDWALATDGLQWIVQHRRQRAGKDAWRLVSFVRSSRDVLERCLREKGAGTSCIQALTADLPDTFDQWIAEGGER
jgi:hypothetical protein